MRAGLLSIMQRGYCLSGSGVIVRAVLLYHSAGLIAYHSAVLIVNHSGGLHHHAAGCCYSQSCRRSTSSCRGYMVQVAGLIVYHAARFYIIIQRCYSQSFRGVLLYHAAVLSCGRFCFIMPLGVSILNHAGGLHHHAAGTWFR